jgi:hypothetical protein
MSVRTITRDSAACMAKGRKQKLSNSNKSIFRPYVGNSGNAVEILIICGVSF